MKNGRNRYERMKLYRKEGEKMFELQILYTEKKRKERYGVDEREDEGFIFRTK